MLRPDGLRREPLAYLPALLALAVLSLPAEAPLISLCSGSTLPGQPDRDCDTACHVGCSREKKLSVRL